MNSFPNILKFDPIYKDKIWGGIKLKTEFNRNIPKGLIGESWEISDYGNDVSQLSPNIDLPQISFRELYRNHTELFLGSSFKNQSFPLLIKIIDAQDKLSVQVHPDDAYAEKYDPASSGKKECWFVLSAEKNAELVIGFSDTTDRTSYEKLIRQGRAEEILKKWKVNPGDTFLLNPGTIHAIGKGVVLLEVQQSSDSTYRVYDYGRLGDNGKPRDLHLDKALSVLNFQKTDGSEKQIPTLLSFSPFPRYLLTSNDKFRLEEWNFNQAQYVILSALSNPISFGILHVTSGEITFESTKTTYIKGDTIFLTAKAFLDSEKFQTAPNTKLAFMGAGTDWVQWIPTK